MRKNGKIWKQHMHRTILETQPVLRFVWCKSNWKYQFFCLTFAQTVKKYITLNSKLFYIIRLQLSNSSIYLIWYNHLWICCCPSLQIYHTVAPGCAKSADWSHNISTTPDSQQDCKKKKEKKTHTQQNHKKTICHSFFF